MVKDRSAHLTATFSALADPIRRGILERLSQGEATAGELAKPYDVSLPAISRHLRVLEDAGLLARRKSGRVHHCRLNPDPMAQAARWMAQYRHFWEQRFDALEALLESNDDKETAAWQPQDPTATRTPLSKSGARSKRRGKGSSGPGRKPRS